MRCEFYNAALVFQSSPEKRGLVLFVSAFPPLKRRATTRRPANAGLGCGNNRLTVTSFSNTSCADRYPWSQQHNLSCATPHESLSGPVGDHMIVACAQQPFPATYGEGQDAFQPV